jgi:hypothetical protein
VIPANVVALVLEIFTTTASPIPHQQGHPFLE